MNFQILQINFIILGNRSWLILKKKFGTTKMFQKKNSEERIFYIQRSSN